MDLPETAVLILSPAERARLGRRAQLVAGASVGYNVIEAVIAIAAGVLAGSVALGASVSTRSDGLHVVQSLAFRPPKQPAYASVDISARTRASI